MKTLHLMRHGKSSWEIESVKDLDRPLLERGVRNSYMMAERFLKNNKCPDLIICSSANRAMHTAHIFARTVGYPVQNIRVAEEIYESDNATIFEVIKNTASSVSSLMLVGHNPNFTEIANWYLDHEIENLSTSGIVSIEFDCEYWNEIQRCEHKAKYDNPKES